jgi:hypothetical protein
METRTGINRLGIRYPSSDKISVYPVAETLFFSPINGDVTLLCSSMSRSMSMNSTSPTPQAGLLFAELQAEPVDHITSPHHLVSAMHSHPPILRLPPEIILRIIDELSAGAVALLAQTCRIFAELARSDDVWRPRCLELWRRHRAQSQPARLSRNKYWDWARLWRSLLGPYQRYLGMPY